MMNNEALANSFSELSTPLVADACVRLGVPLRLAPGGIRPLIAGSRVGGQALPTRHYGSVDIFLEAMHNARPGDVLVIDNSARSDEGCVGDLTVLEAQVSGLAGIIVWGCHRDTAELREIGFPVFSLGTCSAGPVRLDPREQGALLSARVGPCEVLRGDAVFADDDGVLFVARQHLDEVLTTARTIWQTERRQAACVKDGETLREQLRLEEYLEKRKSDPAYTFRQHLRILGGAIEE